MNNVVNMVNYYIVHKNADQSVIEYLKNKIDNSTVDELILIQIKLLYTDPSDKLVSELVHFISNKINEILSTISLSDLINLISILSNKTNEVKNEIKVLEEKNKIYFDEIKSKDLNNDNIFDDKDSVIASNKVNDIQNNNFIIGKNKSEIKAINIWLLNLKKEYNKKLDSISIEDLLNSYINILSLLNRDKFINENINSLSNKIDSYLLDKDVFDTIVNIMPEIDSLYKENANKQNKLYKLLDYYIDLVDNKIKETIKNMLYEERILLKEKINIVCKDILENDNPLDDFKVLVINSYLRYLN